MPTLLIVEGFRFFFFSNEFHEPPHIHVEKAEGYAKFWLGPIQLVYSEGFSRPQMRRVRELIFQYQKSFLEKWNEHFNQ